MLNNNNIVSQQQKKVNNNLAVPVPLPVIAENIPAELKEYKSWCVWKYALVNDRWTKQPHRINGKRAASNRPHEWCSFISAITCYTNNRDNVDGIGFFLHSERNGVIGVDIDHVVDGDIKPECQTVIDQFASYAEYSPSGEGLRILVSGTMPAGGRKNGNYEIYGDVRYVTITGHTLNGLSVISNQSAIDNYHTKYIKKDNVTSSQEGRVTLSCVTPASNTASPVAIEQDNPTLPNGASLDDVIKIASQARNGEKFKALWDGDISDYPSHSEADCALCSLLSFYCGDVDFITSAFRESGLYREKWEREDYRRRTIKPSIEKYDWSYFICDQKIEEIITPFDFSSRCSTFVADNYDDEPCFDERPYKKPSKKIIDDIKPSRLIRWGEMCERADSQKEDWLLKNWIEFGSSTMLTGNPFSGKSCIIAELIGAISLHGKFAGVDVPRCPVIMIDMENRDRIIRHRLKRAVCGNDKCYFDTLGRYLLNENDLPLTSNKLEDIIKESMTQFDKTKFTKFKPLVIIDTFRSAFDCDEMETKSIKELLYPLQRVAQRTDAAILILHHRPKTGSQYSGQTAIAGALDYMWMWQSDIDTRAGKLSLVGTRGDLQEPLNFLLNEDNRNIFTGLPQADQPIEIERLIIEAITVSPAGLNKGEIVKYVQHVWKGEIGVNKIRRFIDVMEKDVKIIGTIGVKNAKIYTLI